MPKEFVDTNIWLYANDARDLTKQEQARKCLRNLNERSSLVISTQVLIEFFTLATRKLCIPGPEARAIAERMATLDVIEPTKVMVLDALDLSNRSQISTRDALIIVAAATRRCTTIWSEDLNPRQKILGVEVKSPFRS
jgi:predicted nucleic acid-binding protein